MQRSAPWLVGLDLVPEHSGPLALAHWLAEGASAAPLVGVHVVEDSFLRFAGEDRERILDAAQAHIAEVLRDDGVLGRFAAREASTARSVEAGLESAALRHGARGLVLGRWSRRDARTVVKLGRITRRMLRALPVPVIVTPPELAGADLGDGPIVAAVELADHSIEAVRFAAALAREHGRRLVLAHIGAPYDHAAVYRLDAGWSALRIEHRRRLEGEAKAWAAAHAPADAELFVTEGDLVAELLALADARRSPMIVVGSRRLTLTERLFGSSVSSGLAALARVPVAVVPPPGDDAAG
ncbi:MAG: universal stress protein [Nannocystaceae bacterium]